MTGIDKFLDSLVGASKQLNINMPNSPHTVIVMDERNEQKCLALYNDGWVQDGFDYVPDSSDIITYWKKDGNQKQIQLTIKQQQRWIRELEKKKKKGEI